MYHRQKGDQMPLEYCTVRVNLTTIAADGIDVDDIPDDTPLTGALELAPMIATGSAIQYSDGETLKLKTVSVVNADIGITGDIAHQGRDYVKVLAPTAATTNLAQLQWRASFKNLRFGSQTITMQPIYFYATPGAEINLAEHVNVSPSSLAVQLSRGPRGFGIAEVATDVDTDELVFKLDDDSGTEVGRVGIPESAVSEDSIALTQLAPSVREVVNSVADKLDAPSADVRYAPGSRSVYGPRWVFDGDSITINGIATSSGIQDRGPSWTSELVRQSMGRIRYVHNAAVAGQRTDDALARFDLYVAPQSPDVVFLTAGTNDIGAVRDMSAWLADLEAYRLKCVAIKAQLVVGAIWPSDTNSPAGRSATARTWNNALYEWAESHGVQVVPWDTLANAATGGWPAGWSSDSLHPTQLDAYAQIGKFGWSVLEPRVGPPVIRRAVSNAADSLVNGFFTAGSILAAPTLSAGTPSTASGTLPAGIYAYKFTSRTYWNESAASAAMDVTLSATGKNSITYSTVTGARGFRVYRKGPGDADYKYLTYITSALAGTFSDDGSFTPGAALNITGSALVPTGLVTGSATLHGLGGGFLTEPGVRGNFFRLTPYETGSGVPNDHFPVAVNPGEVYDASALVRTSGAAEGWFVIRFRDGASTNIGQVIVAKGKMTNGFGLANRRLTIPAGTVTARASFELTNSSDVGYLDVAEVQFRRVG